MLSSTHDFRLTVLVTKIVLQAWHDLPEFLLTVKDITAKRFSLIPDKHDNHHQVIQEVLSSTEDLLLTDLVILDNHLQEFFEMVSEMNDVVTKPLPNNETSFVSRGASVWKDWRTGNHRWLSSLSACDAR